MNAAWKEDALQTIARVFRKQFLDDRLCVTESTSPLDIDEWDSLAHINLLASVESEFEIRFTADDMATIDSVAAMLRVISLRQGQMTS